VSVVRVHPPGEAFEWPGSGTVSIPLVATRSVDAALAALAQGLDFPAYYGRNRDAFDECLGDLAWIAADPVVLAIEARDETGGDVVSYLTAAVESAADWLMRTDGRVLSADVQRRYVASFPAPASLVRWRHAADEYRAALFVGDDVRWEAGERMTESALARKSVELSIGRKVPVVDVDVQRLHTAQP
jgi:hypothetical protein